MARLPKLEQAANHNGTLKRPEGPEAATGSLGRRLPWWGLPTGEWGPRLGPSRQGGPPDTWGCPPGACSPITLYLSGRLTRESPSQSQVPGKESDWPSLSHVPIPGSITVAMAGSHGHRII